MRRPVSTRPRKSARTARLRVESLEDRLLLSVDLAARDPMAPLGRPAAAIAVAVPGAIARPVAAPSAAPGAGPAASAPYSPAQIRHAYGIDQLTYDGSGQTIAIVDAYDDPTIASDLKAFDAQFGLPDSVFTKATPPGQPAPTYDGGWATEIALDVEWAHAIAPRAAILLVEASDASDTALLGAVDYAVRQGVNQVSMSWGGGEFAGVSSIDYHFNHPGVTFLASSGDGASDLDFPAVSPYVTGVGGTTLRLDSAGNRASETGWAYTGGGISTQVARPSYQAGFVAGAYRGVPDVSYVADTASSVYVYNNGGFAGVGGTSVGAPQWAGLIALANQGRAAAGLSPLGTGQAFGTNSVLYGLAGGSSYTNPRGDFFDITSAGNYTPATTGYDTSTGLGSPIANKLIPDLVGTVTPTPTPTPSPSPTPTPTPTPTPPPSAPQPADPAFQVPQVGPAYAYDPAQSSWSFSGYAGVTGNRNAFTSGGPDAPVGSQVGFVQMDGRVWQSIAGWSAGSYTVSLQALQRLNNVGSSEDFQVLVDGSVVGVFTPSGPTYQTLTTASFAVGAGTHTLAFQGLNSKGGDNTALITAVAIQPA